MLNNQTKVFVKDSKFKFFEFRVFSFLNTATYMLASTYPSCFHRSVCSYNNNKLL